MTGCSAVECTNRSEQGFIMKAFPRDPTIRNIWEKKVKRKNWKASDKCYLCEVSQLKLS